MAVFDAANSRLTDQLAGRTINYVVRKGKELEFVCDDGHVVILQADVDGDIHHKKTDVRVMLPGVEMYGIGAKI